MEEKALQIRVGLLILLAIALLVGFVLVLGDFSVGKGFEFEVVYTHSGDVASGAAVRVGGIRVGKVKEVTFLEKGEIDPKTGKPLLIRLKIWAEERARSLLRKDSEIFITARGVLGEKYVGIHPGKSPEPLDLAKPVRGQDPPQTDLIAARLFDFIENLTDMLRRDGHLIRRILQKGGDVMEIVYDILRENRDNVKGLIAKAGGTMDKVSGMIDDARPIVGDVRAVLGRVRKEMDGRISSILDNVKGVTAVANREAPRLLKKVGGLADKAVALADDGRALVRDLRGLLGPNKERIARIMKSVLKLSEKASDLVQNIHGMVARIARGEGSIGALLKDDELYDNLREMLRDIKQHPWKVLWKD
jgi:phospholipid/cholesterol/gamma-HCH transport system substrate-binding protein